MKKIFIASDHGGFDFKQVLVAHLNNDQIKVIDLGPNSNVAVDYPDFADSVCNEVLKSSDHIGILICGSGQGMAMRANKYQKIRAALVWDLNSTKLARQHNDANILCMGGRMFPHKDMIEWVYEFLKTEFEAGRHQPRVNKVSSPCKI